MLFFRFSPDGALLSLGERMSTVVRIWDMATLTERAALTDPAGAIVAAVISPDGTILAVAHYRGLVTFWDLATLKARGKRLTHEGVCAVAFAPDNRVLATGGFDGVVHLWDMPGSIGGDASYRDAALASDRQLSRAAIGRGRRCPFAAAVAASDRSRSRPQRLTKKSETQ